MINIHRASFVQKVNTLKIFLDYINTFEKKIRI